MLEQLGRGYAWLDTGTHESMMDAGNYIATVENRQGLKVCCPEEIAWQQGWIDTARLRELAAPLAKTGYGQYLLRLVGGWCDVVPLFPRVRGWGEGLVARCPGCGAGSI